MGCDCIGLVIGVLDELSVRFDGKLPSELDQRDYTMQPDGKRLNSLLWRYLEAIALPQMQVGHIALMRFEKEPQHVGIIGNYDNKFSLIHCYQGVGKVVEHHLDEKWRRRIVAAFSF